VPERVPLEGGRRRSLPIDGRRGRLGNLAGRPRPSARTFAAVHHGGYSRLVDRPQAHALPQWVLQGWDTLIPELRWGTLGFTQRMERRPHMPARQFPSKRVIRTYLPIPRGFLRVYLRPPPPELIGSFLIGVVERGEKRKKKKRPRAGPYIRAGVSLGASCPIVKPSQSCSLRVGVICKSDEQLLQIFKCLP